MENKIQFLKKRINQMQKAIEADEKRIDALLRDYASRHRIYPDGYQFSLGGHQVVISNAFGITLGESVCIAYGLVDKNGEPFDALLEENVNHPDYI